MLAYIARRRMLLCRLLTPPGLLQSLPDPVEQRVGEDPLAEYPLAAPVEPRYREMQPCIRRLEEAFLGNWQVRTRAPKRGHSLRLRKNRRSGGFQKAVLVAAPALVGTRQVRHHWKPTGRLGCRAWWSSQHKIEVIL